MASPPRATFGTEFLDWVRTSTEAVWRLAEEASIADYEAAGVGGAEWARGTRWIGGYSDTEIDAFERRDGVTFPADFRLFLRRLGCTEPKRRNVYFLDQTNMAERAVPGFYDWRDAGEIARAREDALLGLKFDVERNSLWRDEWGPRPGTAEAREQELRRVVAAAPKLAPLFGHRFLLLEPAAIGNPVLSIHQSDMIVYGADLRRYLLNELVDELSGPRDFEDFSYPAHREIPFWGGFL